MSIFFNILSRIATRGGRSPDGVPPPSGVLGESQVTLSQLTPYLTETTATYRKYTNVPWGPCFGVNAWIEPTTGNTLTQPVMDIYVPLTAAPPTGRPCAVRGHANGSNHVIEPGNSLDTYWIQKAIAENMVFCTVEFRHPVPNEALGVPHYDMGYCLQFIRSLHAAIEIDRNSFLGIGQSRGNLLIWQAYAPEMADAGSANYAKRQSSRIQAMWSLNGQTTYNNTEYIDNFIVPEDRAAAYTVFPNNPLFGSAYQLLLTTDNPIPICIAHDFAYVNPLPSTAVGQHTLSNIVANTNLRLHNPEFGKLLAQGYIARGLYDRITHADLIDGGEETMSDAIEWFKHVFLLNSSGNTTAKEARAIAVARRKNFPIHYIDKQITGAVVSTTDFTPVTTVGAQVGALLDGQFGKANRLSTSPQGNGMGQLTVSRRPTLALAGLVNGVQRHGLAYNSTNSRMFVPQTAASSNYAYSWTMTSEVAGTAASTATQYSIDFQQAGIANNTVVLSVGSAAGAASFNAESLKWFRQFAQEISGVGY